MSTTDTLINHVSDTSLWVAYYRAKETRRADALFKDPLAEVLIGDRGQKIAEDIANSSPYPEWTVIMRTVIIDEYICKAIQLGIDTVINLGAGLDTRPYRMQLPQALKWIEVDYPHVIAYKSNLLKSEIPRFNLTRVELDLADDKKRKNFLQQTALTSEKILVITEGVVLYLTEAQTKALANDLNNFPAYAYWIVEYITPEVYPHLKNALNTKLKNSPFQFFPADWLLFFNQVGWVPEEIRYNGEESDKLGRKMPLPPLAFIFKIFKRSTFKKAKRSTGFILLQRKN